MTKKRVANIKQYSGTYVGNHNKNVFELSKDLCECSVKIMGYHESFDSVLIPKSK